MTITSSTCGVWTLDDSYKKITNGCWASFDGLDTATPGELWAWGVGSYCALICTDIGRSSPIQITSSLWISVDSTSFTSTHVVRNDGVLYALGRNQSGVAGTNCGCTTQCLVPIPGKWLCTTRGGAFCSKLGLKADGTLWGWGQNSYGMLGQGDTIARSSPIQIPGTQWCNMAMGYNTAAAIKTDGTMWIWGNNIYGQHGIGDTINRSSPIQGPAGSWTELSMGFGCDLYTVAGIKTDGTLWTWGANYCGGLGLNNLICRCSPTQIAGTWVFLGCSTRGGLWAINSAGTAFAWGKDFNGSLGINKTSPVLYSAPCQMSGTGWQSISSSYASGQTSSVGVTSAGALFTWGVGNYGALGLNDTISRSQPTQVPGTCWLKATSAGLNQYAIKKP